MTILGWLLLLSGVAPLIARFSRSTQHIVVILACLAPGVSLVAVLAGCAFTVRYTTIGLIAAGLELLLVTAFVWSAPHRKPARTLTVLTLNLRLGLADPDAVLALLRSAAPDVLMLQELTAEALTALELAGLATELAHRFTEPHPQGSGIALFSRRPLTDRISHEGFVNHVLSARVELPDGTDVTVVAAHLSAPWPQPGWRWRWEAGSLGTLLHGLPGPLVLGGDLNATRSHRVFRDLLAAGAVRDAVRRTTLRTFPARLPVLGIDHVLVRGLGVGRVRTARVSGSDHRGLLAEVGLIVAEQ